MPLTSLFPANNCDSALSTFRRVWFLSINDPHTSMRKLSCFRTGFLLLIIESFKRIWFFCLQVLWKNRNYKQLFSGNDSAIPYPIFIYFNCESEHSLILRGLAPCSCLFLLFFPVLIFVTLTNFSLVNSFFFKLDLSIYQGQVFRCCEKFADKAHISLCCSELMLINYFSKPQCSKFSSNILIKKLKIRSLQDVKT